MGMAPYGQMMGGAVDMPKICDFFMTPRGIHICLRLVCQVLWSGCVKGNSCDFAHIAQAAHRRSGQDSLSNVVVLHYRFQHFGFDTSRANRVDSDPVRGLL